MITESGDALQTTPLIEGRVPSDKLRFSSPLFELAGVDLTTKETTTPVRLPFGPHALELLVPSQLEGASLESTLEEIGPELLSFLRLHPSISDAEIEGTTLILFRAEARAE